MNFQQTIQELARLGVFLPGALGMLPEGAARDFSLAMDAQPVLSTTQNAGIPSFLTTFIDPKLIEVLFTANKAALIVGEEKKGDWLTMTAAFPVVESTGTTASYGDFSTNGSTGANFDFPQRQSYHYQTITEWGEKQAEIAGLAKIDWVNRLNIASALVLNKFQNKSYFFGIAGLQNYGLLNDPNLLAPIAPTSPWSGTTTPDVIYADITRLFNQLQTQANGLVDLDTPMVLAMSPSTQVQFTKTNQFNVNVSDQIKKNYPNITMETAPEYATTAGNLVQLIVKNYEGQDTATTAYTEKMRAHQVIPDLSSWKQKKSQGTWGTIIFRPMFIAQMLGV